MALGLEFASCWQKLGHSESHADTLKREILAWQDRNPYSISKECNADGSEYAFVLRVKEKPLVDRWSLIASDCIHNLRSALDHLIYAIAIRESGSNPPPKFRTLQFPIGDDWDSFQKQLRYIDSLTAKAQAVIESVQPYHRPHPEMPPLLTLVRDFDDSDKHRLLKVAMAAIGRAEFRKIGHPDIALVSAKPHVGSVEDSTILARITVSPPKLNVAFEYDVEVRIVIEHAIGPSGFPFADLYGLMYSIKAEVASVVNIVGGKVI